MKARYQNYVRESNYYNYLLEALCSMFVWEVPEEINPYFLELWLHCYGSFGAQKFEDLWYVSREPSLTGTLDMFGDGTMVQGAVLDLDGTHQIYGERDKDAFICYNNKTRTPDLDMFLYANYLSNVDKAIMINTKLSGLAPILNSNSTQTATTIEQIMNRLLEGEVKTVTSDNIIQALQVPGDSSPLFSVDITNPERIRNVQYQSELYDTLLRRFFNKFGLNMRTTAKHAQVSTDEVNGMDCVSWVLPISMLEARQEFAKKVGWKVDFAEPWKQEYEAYNLRKLVEDTTEESEVQEDVRDTEERESSGPETGQSGGSDSAAED